MLEFLEFKLLMSAKLIVLGLVSYLRSSTSIYFSRLGRNIIAFNNLSKRLIEGQSGISPLLTCHLIRKIFSNLNNLK